MIDFYFAGNHHQRIAEFVRDNNLNVLCSYVNDIKAINNYYFNYKRSGWTGKLLIDNGAFTMYRNGATIDIDEYIKWLNENDDYIDYAIALDVIPGIYKKNITLVEIEKAAEVTFNNYLYMRSKVKSPNKLLPVFHQGDDFKWLNKYLEISDLHYMCLSANKTNATNEQRERFYAESYVRIKRSSNPNIKCHCLGSATFQNAEKFPFVSMDATSHIKYAIYGYVIFKHGVIYVGDNFKEIGIDGSMMYKEIKHFCDKYNLDIERIGNDWLERTLFNAYYLQEQADVCICKRNEFVAIRRLF